MRLFRFFLWAVFFAVASFCWVVVIEHGPENFFEGTRIEVENLQWLILRTLK
jgi:hypothetical protein